MFFCLLYLVFLGFYLYICIFVYSCVLFSLLRSASNTNSIYLSKIYKYKMFIYIYIKGIGDDNEFRNGDGLVGSVQSVETVKSSKNPLPNSNSQSSETQNTTQMEAIRVLFEQEGPQSLNCFIAFGGCFTKHRFQSSGSRAGRVSEVH